MSTHDVYSETDISNYSLSELMAIIGVEDLDPTEITQKTQYLKKKFEKTNPQYATFFMEIESQLLQYAQGLEVTDSEQPSNKIIVESYQNMGNQNEAIFPEGQKITSDWYENQYLEQDDKNQTDKITNRQQKIQTYNNQHTPMNREQIATTDTYDVPVKQDSLNPNLKNTVTRILNLDSQFRQYTSGVDSTPANYTLDLSDTLKDTISISLFSYQIPKSWYLIDKYYGNTCFWIINNEGDGYIISIEIPSGNYTTTTFPTALEDALTKAGFTFTTSPVVSISPNNGKITLFLNGGVYSDGGSNTFTIAPGTTQILFFDFKFQLLCENNCFSKSTYFLNSTLGWLMGFRLPYIDILEEGNEAPAIIDLNGTKYLILVLDDFNQNHINNSLVSISKFDNTLKIPNYYSNDLVSTCRTTEETPDNLNELITGVTAQSLINFQTTNPLNGLLIGGKYEDDYKDTQVIIPSAPRQLTQSQIYTINEINRNRNMNTTQFLSNAPTSGDILATIPIKASGVDTGTLIVEFSGSLQSNKRVYFGPVDIDRMGVKLLNDKGNVLHLNGNDWCVTLLCECLYQY
jgi:hypothetical protein